MTPLAVVRPKSLDEVANVMAICRRTAIPLTFRSGGTSLSGQAGTDGVLVDTRRHFRTITVLDSGARVRVGPGATVRAVNNRLASNGRKLGPDPASEIACTVGGVVANNSSGMSCGVHANSYCTLDSVVVVLPSGTVVDTGVEGADLRLREAEPGLYHGLHRLRERVRGNEESVRRLRKLHALKNTMGYGLNSFLDFDRPIEILQQLMVGSEGTLAFVAEATFRTVPTMKYVATELLVFPNLADATTALPALVDAGLATIELMDAASLRVGQRDPEAPEELRELNIVDHAALLVEYQEETEDNLARRLTEAPALLARLPLSQHAALRTDSDRRARLWHIRKGLYAAVAGARPPGTTALLEDIAVPVERLAETCAELQRLFDRHGYEGCVIFGHAKDGNIHFLLNERFDRPEMLARYEAFTEDMVQLVLSQGGTLKAEHGTGRAMAPYVRRQYGDELFDVMWELKRLVDPDLLLNPGVLLSHDPDSHTRHLKTAPPVEEEVDRCVECGYCEPVCPSRDLTRTPRERIVLRRELERARNVGDVELARTIENEYEYDGIQTCAVDGMCQTACPVLINTGDLVRRLRSESVGPVSQAMWKTAAGHWDAASRAGSLALSIGNAIPTALPAMATRLGRSIIGDDVVPLYTEDLPAGGQQRRVIASDDPAAVYFSSCTQTMFAGATSEGVAESFLRLCEQAGIGVSTPQDIPSLCCGTPWKSKGFTDGYDAMKARVRESLLRATRGGDLPVVCDASSCSEGLAVLLDVAAEGVFRVVDAVAFIDEHVLARLPRLEQLTSLTIHPTCSSTQLGINGALQRVAEAAAHSVTVPEDWGCCAFAGDRGMLHPELTAVATKPAANNVAAQATAAYASLNRTCEIGMTRATGETYVHILQVLAQTLPPISDQS
ncbi:FAD-binding oxidoreductase [Arthrobacter sp. CJ23]|nr:FAD-binding and (Fe-S)-binding domain-containing protein [Arthrobacter sp. CJ23]UVJ39228.1 FAD-binding oxidoreductase [Arthrobacter sp. CJ23]